jgi:hypothetical protein
MMKGKDGRAGVSIDDAGALTRAEMLRGRATSRSRAAQSFAQRHTGILCEAQSVKIEDSILLSEHLAIQVVMNLHSRGR